MNDSVAESSGLSNLSEPAPLRLTTLLRFWAGDLDAIRDVAASRSTLPIGAAFMVTAWIARNLYEYRGAFVSEQPANIAGLGWAVLVNMGIVFGISLVASALLHGLARLAAFFAGHEDTSLDDVLFLTPSYPQFLAAWWLTAPFAWLYAIPFEDMLSYEAAMSARLITLGVVSVWRTRTAVRSLRALMGFHRIQAGFLVLTFVCLVGLPSLGWFRFRLIPIMGSFRHPADRDFVFITTVLLNLLVGGLPVGVIGTLISFRKTRPRPLRGPRRPVGPPAPGLIAFVAGSVVFWLTALLIAGTIPPR